MSDVEVSQSALLKAREEKYNAIKEANIPVYPNRFDRQIQIKNIRDDYFKLDTDPREVIETDVVTAGRIMSKRTMGKAAFIEIRDETGQIQLYGNNKGLSEEDYLVFKNLDLGDIIGIEGHTFLTKTQEPSIHAKSLKILSKNLSPIPVVKEKDGKVFDAFSDVETRYRKRYLDLIVNPQVKETFEIRSKIIHELRNFLIGRGFLEVETPMMQSVASGAAARPFETYHNTLEMPLFLRIAPELYLKRLIIGGFEKVFEINRNFRNEGISKKHNPEFTMMELYQAYADYQDMMKLTESLVLYLAERILGSRQIPYGNEMIDLSPPWKKQPYLDIIAEKSGADFREFLEDENPPVAEAKSMAQAAGVNPAKCKTFWEVVDETFSEKVEPELIQPIFITEFPKAISPLAKSIPGNEFLVERFEPYITGREMGNSFSELNDPFDQRERFTQQQKMQQDGAEETIAMDEDYIEALRVGMPPTGGLGIGIDRLVMLFTNSPSIRDVILFPLLRKR